MPSIEDCPPEIIYRLFDKLDIDSIISFSLTCKRYFDCLNKYDQYEINFQSVSKTKFDLVCRLIKPSNIISLTLSDNDQTPGQMKLFLKKIPFNRLNRLKSLKLIEINENDLEDCLKNLSTNSFNSLYIEYRKYFTFLNPSTISILNEILSLKSLKKLALDMRSFESKDCFSWPSSTDIEDLTLFNLNFNQFLRIIERSNRYQSIVLRNLTMKDSNEINSKKISLKNLKSFQIERSEFILDQIISLLTLMTELVYLKLEGFTNLIQLNDIESFFQRKSEFFIRYCPSELIRSHSLISSSNSSFHADWLKSSNEIYFYSIPPPIDHLKYSNQINFISFNEIQHLELNLNDLQSNGKARLFPKLNSLKLFVSDQCSFDCFQSLSQLIHLDHLTTIILIICSRGEYLHLMLNNFLRFLKEFPRLHCIEIFNRWHGLFTYIDIHDFCSMIPRNVKHLDLDLSDINETKILIKQLDWLWSLKVKYSFEKSFLIKDILQWLSNERINVSYVSDIHYLAIWISQQTKRSNPNKRMKYVL